LAGPAVKQLTVLQLAPVQLSLSVVSVDMVAAVVEAAQD
jgi:hypothetical protein